MKGRLLARASANERHEQMVKAKKPLTSGIPRIQLNKPLTGIKPSEPSLFLQRIRELDREFAEQAKQLAKLTKKFSKKITKKL
jgi:hypothetical protein